MSRYEHRRPFERTKGGDGWSHGVSIRSGRNNAGSRLDRHGGRWLMTLPQTPEQISTPKDSSLFFHLRDTELLVTEFPGCGTRFFLPITTCHATLSLSPSFPSPVFPLRPLLPLSSLSHSSLSRLESGSQTDSVRRLQPIRCTRNRHRA